MSEGPQRLPLADLLADMAPLLRRVVDLDPRSVARVRTGRERVTVFVRLPFGVLAARTIAAPDAAAGGATDRTFAAADLLAHVEHDAAEPVQRDAEWRGAVPPAGNWTRVDTVPDAVVRGLVRTGALALKEAAAREGVPTAQPRAEVADALLDSVVLTVEGAGRHAEVALRPLSALTRMGFLPRGSHAAVDVAGRWTRVVGEYGSIYSEASAGGLQVLG